MGKIKNWMIDQEELVWNAVDSGITDYESVLAYVSRNILADTRYVRQIFNEVMSFDRLTEDALDDVSERHNSDIIDGYNEIDRSENSDY